MGPARLRRRRTGTRRVAGWVRVAVLIAALLAIVLGLWLGLDERFYVYEPTVLGAEVVPVARIIQASRLLGLHVFWVRTSTAASNILSEPGILSARVHCELPAECTIVVVEMPPLITWQDGGKLWQIDESGLAVRADTPLEDGWYVQGPLPLNDAQELAEPVRVGLQELAKLGVDLTRGTYYTPDRGIAFVDERGWLVIVGVGPGMAQRVLSLNRVAASLISRGVSPEWVDVHIAARPFIQTPEG